MNNSFKEKVKNMENTKQHFSIRKFNVGVVSVLLGLSFIGLSNSQKVDAAVNGVNNDSQSQKSNEQQSASQNKNVLLNSNENKKVDSNNQQEVRNNNSNSTSDSLKQSSNTNNTSESSKQLNNEKKSVANTNVDHLKKNGVLYGNAEAENQIIIYTEPSKDLTPVNQEKGQYKFSDGMKVVGRVFSGYYQKDDSVWADHNANTFEKSRDELVYKDHTGNGKLTLDIAKIAPDYSNYEFDLDFSKQLDATRTDEFQKGKNNGQVEFDYHKVLDDAKNTPFLKNTTYQLFIKPKTQSRLQIKRVHDHSNETLLNWFSNGEGTQHDTYLGTSVVDDYSMGVGTYVNKGLRKAHPDIPIDAQATKYALNLNQQNNADWKFEVNGTNDSTFGPNGFMPVNSSHTEANFDFEKLPSKSLTINRGYLDPGKGSTENNAIPEASPISGYTNPNEIPIFIELGNGNKITKIVSLSGKPGETIEVKNKITLPEGAIFDPTSPQLPSTYTFSKNGHNYNDKTAIFATTIRTDNVAYLTKNPALISQSNLTKNDALSLLQNPSIDWIPGAKENIDKYLQSNPIEKTVKESIYINGKLYKVESLNLNRTITFDKSKGKTVIYNNPDNPDIVRSFGAWENDKWQKVEDFASENIELPKDASNVKTDKGIIKDGKLTDVSLFNDAGDPCDVVVNISYDVTPSKGDDTKPTTPSKGDDTKPSTPSKGDDTKPTTPSKGDDTKPSTPSKGDDTKPSTPSKGDDTKPTTPSKGDDTKPSTPSKGDDTKPTTPSKGDDTKPTTPSKGDDTKPSTPSKGDDTKPSTPSKGDDTKPTTPSKGDETKPSTPSKGDEAKPTTPSKGDDTKPSTPSKGDDTKPSTPSKGDGTKPSTPSKGDDTKPTTPSKGDDTKPSTPSKGDDTKPTTPSKGDDTKVDSSNAKVFFVVSHKAIVYDKNGRPIKKNGKIITLTKNTFVASLKKAKIVTIKGKKFYQVGKNEFIKVNNVKKVTEKNASKKLVRVSHNAFVYTKNGKAIKNKLHYKLIKRGHSVKLAKNKVVIIKGKKFYQIGKNEFIKVANTKLSTKAIKLRASLKNHRVAQTYDRSGNLNNHYIKGNHVYNFNEKATINGKTYYKLAWTNNWVPASKLTLK